MSKANTGFDPREAIEGLFGYVREMAASGLNRGAKPQPNEDRVEGAILAALESGAKTVSQILSAISFAAGGTWTPSEGQINKSLSKLSDAGLTATKTKADRKIYSLTKAGEEALASARETVPQEAASTSSSRGLDLGWMNCDPNFLKSASKLPPVMLDIAQTASREQQAKAAQILEKARHDLHQVLAE